jgi:hypothetical protein
MRGTGHDHTGVRVVRLVRRARDTPPNQRQVEQRNTRQEGDDKAHDQAR